MIGTFELDGGPVDDEEYEGGGEDRDTTENHLHDGIDAGPSKPFSGNVVIIIIIVGWIISLFGHGEVQVEIQMWMDK